MSATEVIDRIKALSPEEFACVREFILSGDARVAEQPVRYASLEESKAAVDWVFKEHAELLRRLAE